MSAWYVIHEAPGGRFVVTLRGDVVAEFRSRAEARDYIRKQRGER